jgi:hypothetical protein
MSAEAQSADLVKWCFAGHGARAHAWISSSSAPLFLIYLSTLRWRLAFGGSFGAVNRGLALMQRCCSQNTSLAWISGCLLLCVACRRHGIGFGLLFILLFSVCAVFAFMVCDRHECYL